jgi:hypothetical protein
MPWLPLEVCVCGSWRLARIVGFPTRTTEPPLPFEVQPESESEVQEKLPPDCDVTLLPATEEGLCNDGIDNDNDGLIDTEGKNDCPPAFEVQPPPGFDPVAP